MDKSLYDTFVTLVKIDSPSGFEDEIARYLKKILAGLGANVIVDKTGNLFARFTGSGEPVVLSAHLDTVEPGRKIKPVVVGGIIKSASDTILGADNKVFIAAVLDAVRKSKNRKSLEIVFSVREETDGGIKYFDFKQLRSKFGIMADTGEPIGTIITSSPWIEEFEIEIVGKSVHSSVPQYGINALKIAANVISKLNLGKVDDLTTVNIGMINGGHVVNSVVGKVNLRGELRSYSKEKFNDYSSSLQKMFEEEVEKYGGQMKFERSLYCKGFYINGDGRLKSIVKSIYKKHKIDAHEENSMGGSDANTFYENGVTLLNLGDGANEVHSFNENVNLTDLQKLSDIVASFISV